MNPIAFWRVKRAGQLLEGAMLVEMLVTGFGVGFVAIVAYGHMLLLQAALTTDEAG